MNITADDPEQTTPDVTDGADYGPDRDAVVPSVPPLMRSGASPTHAEVQSPEPSPAPILITEQQVLFGTSAAVPLQRRKTLDWAADAIRVVAGSMRRMLLARANGARPRRKYHPARYSYLEHSLMAREMDRL